MQCVTGIDDKEANKRNSREIGICGMDGRTMCPVSVHQESDVGPVTPMI